METKICNVCKINQPVYNFNTKPWRNKRYYKHLCKSCQASQNKQKNAARKNSNKIKINQKICTTCGSMLVLQAFTKDAYKSDGLSKTCVECRANYYSANKKRILSNNLRSQRKNKLKNNLRKIKWSILNKLKVRRANQLYYLKNMEKIIEYNKKWAKEHILAKRNQGHRYRTRKRHNTIQKFTRTQLEQRMSVFGFKCAYCEGSFDHIDHVIAISKGGYHCLSNLRPACKKCNQEKHTKSLKEWLTNKLI